MHMEQNVQKHLLWAFKQIVAMERQMEVMKQKKDRQIDVLEKRVATLERHATLLVLSPVEFTVSNYSHNKGNAGWTGSAVDGPLLYTHPRGAKVQVCTWFYSSTVYVQLYRLPGEFDYEIKWPVKCTVTVHLLNQLRDQDHISGSRTYTFTRPTTRTDTVGPHPYRCTLTKLKVVPSETYGT